MTLTQERRAEEASRLRAHILEATLEIAKEAGWESVTIRKIAQRIRYTNPVIYRHFKNKKAILAHLCLMGLEKLQAYTQREAELAANGRDWLEKGAEGYWKFAMDEPELYQLIFSGRSLENELEPLSQMGKAMFQGGIEMIQRMNPSLSYDECHDFLANFFSLLHGYVHLAMHDRLFTEEGGRQAAHRSMQRAVRRLAQQIRTTTS